MTTPYSPPYVRERRSFWMQAFELFCFCMIFGAIIALSFIGAVLIEPPVIP